MVKTKIILTKPWQWVITVLSIVGAVVIIRLAFDVTSRVVDGKKQ